MIPLIGFAPDAPETTPGVITDCSELIPTENGMKVAPTSVSVGLTAMPAACKGAAGTVNLSGTRRLIAGTATKLYEAATTAWTDLSAGTTYGLGSDDTWQFAVFGNSVLAAAAATKIQRSTGTAFADITSAPKAEIIDSVKGFVMALNTDHTTQGDRPDSWWCCALYDETDWAPSVSTQCTTGRLVEGSGELKAGKRLGDDFIAYKSRAIFHGRYAGPPGVWDWTQVSSEIGCVGRDALLDLGVMHIFVGEDDIYAYDGVVRSIATGQVRQWFIDHRDPTYAYRTKLLWDRRNSRVFIFFPNASGSIAEGLVYHTKSGKWGRVARDVEACVNYVSPSITYDGGTPLVTTYDVGPAIPYDSPLWIAGAESPAIFEDDHIIKTINGAASTASLTTGLVGDEDLSTMCDAVKLRFELSPSSATVTGWTKSDAGSTLSAGSTSTRADGKFDMRQTGRWHVFDFDLTGEAEVVAIRPSLKPSGRR